MDYSEHIIELNDRMVKLKVVDFETDIDVDEILKIDYSNILGEVLTFPVLFNRLANLKAEQQEIVSRSKLDMEIYEAEQMEQKRKDLYSKGIAKPTKEQMETAVKMDPNYRLKSELHYKRIKDLDYLDALYWSAKLKCDLLTKVSDKLHPSEFEGDLIAESINGVLIKMSKKAIR